MECEFHYQNPKVVKKANETFIGGRTKMPKLNNYWWADRVYIS